MLPGRIVHYDVLSVRRLASTNGPESRGTTLVVRMVEQWRDEGPPMGEWPVVRPEWSFDQKAEILKNAIEVQYTVTRVGKGWTVLRRVEQP